VTAPARSVHHLAAELRRAFDASFAAPTRRPAEDEQAFLVVSVGDDRYALRVGGLSGLLADRRIVPVPTPWPALLGLVAVRGALLPVFGLRALLDYPPASEPARWLLTIGRSPGTAFAIDRLLRHVRVRPGDVVPTSAQGGRRYVRETVSVEGAFLPVLEAAALHADVEARVAAQRKGG
jgi:chemotaxis signal transduction protein